MTPDILFADRGHSGGRYISFDDTMQFIALRDRSIWIGGPEILHGNGNGNGNEHDEDFGLDGLYKWPQNI